MGLTAWLFFVLSISTHVRLEGNDNDTLPGAAVANHKLLSSSHQGGGGSTENSFTFCFVHGTHIITGQSISCIQCQTTADSDCALNPGGETTNCTADMNYCVVYYSIFETGDVVVFRDCNDIAVDQCSSKTIYEKRVNICYKSCDTDGCNAWPVSSAHRMNYLIINIVLVVLCWFGYTQN